MRTFAPIVLFVYNRPAHTELTLEALSKNEFADQSTLYIFCDGIRKNESPENLAKIEAVRAVCRKKQWTKEVIIREKEANSGLAASIIDGVTELVNKYGKVIVLEDDLETSPGFLRYMNDALDHYEQEEKVMHISGYWFPVKNSQQALPETFFYRTTSCWGWATWKRAWDKLETNAYDLKKRIGRMDDGVRKFNIENTYTHLNQLEHNITGQINTWAVKWYGSVFLNGGLCLHPNVSLVNNIGFDNSGVHCQQTSIYDWPALAGNIKVSSIPLKESDEAIRLLKPFHHQVNGSLFKRAKRKALRMLGRQSA